MNLPFSLFYMFHPHFLYRGLIFYNLILDLYQVILFNFFHSTHRHYLIYLLSYEKDTNSWGQKNSFVYFCISTTRACACASSFASVIDDVLWPQELTAACQTPLSMGFFRQEYWNWLPFPSSGDLPDPGIKLVSLLQ